METALIVAVFAVLILGVIYLLIKNDDNNDDDPMFV